MNCRIESKDNSKIIIICENEDEYPLTFLKRLWLDGELTPYDDLQYKKDEKTGVWTFEISMRKTPEEFLDEIKQELDIN